MHGSNARNLNPFLNSNKALALKVVDVFRSHKHVKKGIGSKKYTGHLDLPITIFLKVFL
jgi:hypothetical protein